MKLNKKTVEIALAKAYAVTKSATQYGRNLTVRIRAGKMDIRSWSVAPQGIVMSGMPVEAGEEVEFVADSARLYPALKKIPTEEFEMKVDEASIRVSSGRLRYSIPRPSEKDEDEPPETTEATFRVMCDDMTKALEKMAPSADTSDLYGPYVGIFAKSDGGRVLLTASDRKSIAYSEFKTATPCADFEAILPREFIDFLSVFDPEHFVDVCFSENRVVARQGQTTIWCGLLAGQYRNLSEKMIRDGVNQRNGGGTSAKVEVKREDFLEMLSRVEIVADKESMRTTLKLGKGEIGASCSSPSGECSDTCPVSGSEGEARVDMNILSMRKAVQPLSAETISMEFFTATPVIFVESATEGFKAFCAGLNDRKE